MLLGNDIVDLQWSPRHGASYFEKLKSYAFSSSELNLLSCNDSYNKELRLLWSVKESCYKSAMKNGCSDRFIPRHFVIDSIKKNDQLTTCTASHSGTLYKSRSYANAKYTHTVALPADVTFDEVVVRSSVIELAEYKYQSRRVRELASNHLATVLTGDVDFGKNEQGIPFVNLEGSLTEIDVSFSHDKNVVGFALMM